MPSVSSATVDSVHGGSARGGTGCGGSGESSSARGGRAGLGSAQCGQRPGGRRLALLALELQVGGKAHRIDAVLLNRFLVTGGEFGVVFIAGARGVVNVI